MAKTRTTFAFPDDDDNKRRKDLVAAAFILEEKSRNSLLQNAQTIDYITNSIEAGNTGAAWHFWAKIPELRYVSRYISNALSVATLYAGKTDTDGGPPQRLPEDHPATQLVKDFAGGFTGQSDLLDRLGLHLTVAGDSVLIGPKSGTGTLEPPFDQWRVWSSEEVHSRNGKIYLKMPANSRELQIPEGTMAVRIWRPHPRLYWDADSPVKGSFQVLKELDMLNMHILSSAASRLVGAGLLGIPDELELPGSDTETEGTEGDQFIALLIEVMGIAKKNPESPAAQIPVMVRGPGDYIDKIKHFDFSTEFSNMVPELRQGAIRRLALGMDVPPEILLGSEQSTSWSAWQCVSEDTEILTVDGWRTHDQVNEGDTVLTLNHETGLTEWQPIVHMFRKENKNNEKPMVSIEGRRHSSLTTWDHKWPVLHARGRSHSWQREWTISADLNAGDRIITAAPHAAPTEAKWSDALVETVAWFWTEGHIRNRGRKNDDISICQSLTANPENVALIRRCLTNLYGPVSQDLGKGRIADPTPKWREDIRPDGKVEWKLNVSASAPILDIAPDRLVALSFIRDLTASQLALFIDRSLRADGHGLKLGQSDLSRLDAFELAGILAGYSVSHHSSVHNGYHEHIQHYVSLGKRSTVQPVTIATGVDHRSLVPYEGIVWCPTTPNATWVARRNGHVFFTGNTDESTLRVHLIPLLQLIVSSLTVGWLRPMLEQLPLTDAQKEELPSLVVHFDVSNLKIHQDISGDAQALYDRFGIDADTLRMAIGYSNDSAPDNKELARQILLSLVATGQPELVLYAIGGLREKFDLSDLPKPPVSPEGAPIGAVRETITPAAKSPGNQPGEGTAPKATTPVKPVVPGPRSQAKQSSPPPVPKTGGDQSNNAVGK